MKKERAVPYSPQSMQVYLQKSFSSLLWHTSITRKMSKKRNPQNFDSEDTQDLLPESELEALQVFVESWF